MSGNVVNQFTYWRGSADSVEQPYSHHCSVRWMGGTLYRLSRDPIRSTKPVWTYFGTYDKARKTVTVTSERTAAEDEQAVTFARVMANNGWTVYGAPVKLDVQAACERSTNRTCPLTLVYGVPRKNRSLDLHKRAKGRAKVPTASLEQLMGAQSEDVTEMRERLMKLRAERAK